MEAAEDLSAIFSPPTLCNGWRSDPRVKLEVDALVGVQWLIYQQMLLVLKSPEPLSPAARQDACYGRSSYP
jgi:hypothetical protein